MISRLRENREVVIKFTQIFSHHIISYHIISYPSIISHDFFGGSGRFLDDSPSHDPKKRVNDSTRRLGRLGRRLDAWVAARNPSVLAPLATADSTHPLSAPGEAMGSWDPGYSRWLEGRGQRWQVGKSLDDEGRCYIVLLKKSTINYIYIYIFMF